MISKVRIISLVLSLILVSFLAACSKRVFPRPTREYYVNDFANVFSSSLKDFIIREGKSLYEDINDNTGIKPGAQVVVASFVVKDDLEEANLRSMGGIDLFNEWRIGKDDLGVLVLFLFYEKEIDSLSVMELSGLPVIITGNQMDQFLVPSIIDAILANTMEVIDDFEIAIMSLVMELMIVIYEKVYNINFYYDLEQLEYIHSSYTGPIYDEALSMNLFLYLLSPHSSISEKIFSLIPFALVFVFSGGLILNKAGGGSSGGTGFFRRRR